MSDNLFFVKQKCWNMARAKKIYIYEPKTQLFQINAKIPIWGGCRCITLNSFYTNLLRWTLKLLKRVTNTTMSHSAHIQPWHMQLGKFHYWDQHLWQPLTDHYMLFYKTLIQANNWCTTGLEPFLTSIETHVQPLKLGIVVSSPSWWDSHIILMVDPGQVVLNSSQ